MCLSTYDDIKMYQFLKKKYEDQTSEELKQLRLKEIEKEAKRRKRKGSVAEDPYDYAKGRELGKQDIGDISYKTPWQEVLYEQTGLIAPVNQNYKCPVCGYEYALDMPPERCIMCGAVSFLHRRKVVNLKE